jgi:hypothetical protein
MTFGHYGYWAAALGSLLAAVAFATLARRLFGKCFTGLTTGVPSNI